MSKTISVEDFEIFKEAMIEENLALQIDIVKKLESLALALGEKMTREELLPFIEINIDLHDELLLNLSEQLKYFVPLVGGVEHSHIIFDILTRLCNTDENIVREKAVETVIHIGKDFDTNQTEKLIWPILTKLINDDWFTSKCSAVMLFSTFYPKLTPEKRTELRNILKTLIQDDSPMVRKAAAMACVDFAAVIEDNLVKPELVPIFCDIGQDPMDSVRSVMIDIALALSKRLEENDLDESIFKMVESTSDDPSWRLRQRLANSIALLQQYIPFGKYRGKIIFLFQKLSKDAEPEVRILVASNVFQYCKQILDSYISQPQQSNNFEHVFEQSILPVIHRLAVDDNDHVRLALSSNILPLSSILSEDCFKNHIVPFLLQVLDNEESMAIQANFLLGISSVSANIDLSKSLNAIKNAIRAVIGRSHTNWRTRRNILTTFVDISRFCDAEYFSDHFKIYYAALLGDPVFAVRRSSTLILPLLAKQYGIKWASKHLVSHFATFTRDSRYLYRYVPLFSINEMIKPCLCSNSDLYLNEFKTIIDNKDHAHNKKAVMALAKIVKISHLVEKKLEEPVFSSMLKLKDKLNYTSDLNINIYSENDFVSLRKDHRKVNVYSINDRDFKENSCPYLQGILSLIYNKFLFIFEILNKDITENIQICAICTLGEISDFLTKLKEEISESWVENVVKSIKHEEILSINEEIHREFKTAILEEEPERIDTNPMEMTDEHDLSETLCIENSALSKVDHTEKNVESKNNDILLVEEVMEILDKTKTQESSTSNTFPLEQDSNFKNNLSIEQKLSNMESKTEQKLSKMESKRDSVKDLVLNNKDENSSTFEKQEHPADPPLNKVKFENLALKD